MRNIFDSWCHLCRKKARLDVVSYRDSATGKIRVLWLCPSCKATFTR